MQFLIRIASIVTLVFTIGCDGGGSGSSPVTDCRNIFCVGDYSCQLNDDDVYECLATNQGGSATAGGNEAGVAGSSDNEAGTAGTGANSGNEAGGQGGEVGNNPTETQCYRCLPNDPWIVLCSETIVQADGTSACINEDTVDSCFTPSQCCEAFGLVATQEGVCELPFMLIEGGSFQMGWNENAEERPIHEVTVSSFELMRTEVTVAQYRVCVDAGVCEAPRYGNYIDNLDNHPINYVSWFEAMTFAEFVGARLPSEAEWEFAARSGGQDIRYPWGNQAPDCDRVNFNLCVGSTTPACTHPTGNTAQGLCDMAGNVYEWTDDDFHFNYNDAPNDGSAWIDTPRGIQRVRRGGSWRHIANSIRAAHRDNFDADYGLGDYYGFRLARSVQ